MNLVLSLVSVLLSLRVLAAPSCPVLGSSFPKPQQLSTSSIISSATSDLTNAINQAISSGTTSHGPLHGSQTSFSIQIFAANSASPLVDFHHTAPSLANATVGVKTVDANSVYRIGSITKVFTMLTFLIEAGDAKWNDPVTNYIPELRAAQANSGGVNSPSWNDITIGNLASYMSGIGRDYSFTDLLTLPIPVNWTTFGLPALKATDIFPCGSSIANASCSRADFFNGFTSRRPVFGASTTPIYSNVAFQIIGYVLESITGKKFPSMLQDDVINKLGLSSTSYTPPTDTSRGVIPDINASWWNVDIGDEGPAGSIYTTSADMTKFGQAILKSSLISPAQTRRWMKPVTHTSKSTLSVGAPWEIRRFTIPDENRLIDIFTKGGDMGTYSAMIGLLPDYDVGFSILASGSASGVAHQDVQILAGLIGDSFIPQLENAARSEANTRFAGTYMSLDPGGTNSTLKLSTTAGQPGLSVDLWTSHGADVTQVISLFNAQRYGVPLRPTVRLYATNVFDSSNFAFRATSGFDLPSTDPGPFSWDCVTWEDVDAIRYGSISLDDFVFTLGPDGKATQVQPRATRNTLQKALTSIVH